MTRGASWLEEEFGPIRRASVGDIRTQVLATGFRGAFPRGTCLGSIVRTSFWAAGADLRHKREKRPLTGSWPSEWGRPAHQREPVVGPNGSPPPLSKPACERSS